MAKHHVIIRSGQLTIELQAQDDQFMGRQLHAWTQAMLGTPLAKSIDLVDALPPRPEPLGVAPSTPANIPESVIIPLPELAKPAAVQPSIQNEAVSAIAHEHTETALSPLEPPSADDDRLVTPVSTPEPVAQAATAAVDTQGTADPISKPAQGTQLETENGVTEPSATSPVTQAIAASEAPSVEDPLNQISPLSDAAVSLPPELQAFYGHAETAVDTELILSETGVTASEEKDTDFSLVLNQVMADFADTEDGDAIMADNAAEGEPEQPTGLIESLADLCDIVHPENAEELLLAAGYYMTFFEGKESFSLKQLNSLLLLANESSISHSVLARAIEADSLSLLADPTGAMETPEYTLTSTSRQQVEGWLKGQR